ncbi:tetratricopeptide repeat protein [Moheibacter sediminis]|uniref:tetratricopeptide repeat protein n=1 Tax=Moheibacter sediminis TaxID=1434700 RepID=UPI0013563299|nr:hypothetical protein [Moheibacter sediminis]
MKDPERAFPEIDELMNEAIENKNKEVELNLLSRISWYYINKDLPKAIEFSQQLEVKAKEYGDVFYEAVAHQILSNIYTRSELPDKALKEFEITIKLLSKAENNSNKQEIIHAKVNAFICANDAYKLKAMNREAANMLLLANQEINSFEDQNAKQYFLRANYTNLGGVFLNLDIDSAEYYINKSFQLSEKNRSEDAIQFNNYIILGDVNIERKNFSQAILNYQKAEKLIPMVNPSMENQGLVFEKLADVYKKTDSLEKANYYMHKWKDVRFDLEKNKNQSLHKIIDDKMLEEKNYSIYIIIGSAIILLIMIALLFRSRKKNKLLLKQEKASEEYLERNTNLKISDEETLSQLVQMAKNNDQAFMPAFHAAFPDFLGKLQSIHSQIVPSEVEFCAFMKLNLSTKDIARYKSIEPKSAQNKKYRIRKKLNIPDDTDIYFWFSTF